MSLSPSSLAWAHPLIQAWFIDKFGAPTEPQIQGWPSILANQSTLISAPTGSGKTLAAFLSCINQLFCQALNAELPDYTQVVYVSPLKALGNDIHKNLTQPLSEICALAKNQSLTLSDIRVAVRTGDTLAHERQAMLKKPPHILITTPESLYILLTAQKSRVMLSQVKTLIVDEIHAMVNDKRGAHLALSLERLEDLTSQPLVRIGLSATQKPLEKVAGFLSGAQRLLPHIVDIGHARHLDLQLELPKTALTAVTSNEMWDELYDRLTELAHQHRSTLIFVNTRRLAERLAHHLAERLGDAQVCAHHGSLSRKLRLDAETRLKNGELKVLVATASLELGIDIGSIDLVCQIGSPRAIAVALQRVGRAGHWHGAISKGRFFPLTRDELIECAALIYAIREGDLDQLIMPAEPLDILAQQIVASCATKDWDEQSLFKLIQNAYPFKDLSYDQYDALLTMLSEGIAGSRGRYGTYLFRDKVNGLVKARRQSRLVAITSGGAIPENGLFTVIAEPNSVMVGTLDEDFAIESHRGDIILLGSTSWRILRIESARGRVVVEDAHGAPPTVPFWLGEAPARTDELSWQISMLRQQLNDKLTPQNAHTIESATQWLCLHCGLNAFGAQQIIDYLMEGKAILGFIPTQQTLIAERFFDEAGGMQLIIHSPFGARINKAWGLALRKRFCRSFNFELQAAATDDGINIALAEQHSFPLADVFHFLHPNTLKEVLTQAVLQSPLFNTRWRWTATRALALVRFRNGKKVPPNILRMLSEDLLAAVFPDAAACQDNLGGRDIELPAHPLIDETLKDILTQALDIEGLNTLLKKIASHSIKCIAVDTPLPSVFSHEILNANPYAFLDDAPLEERRARAVEMRRILPSAFLEDIAKLDPLAIKEVQQQVWPDIRNPDELHDMLQTFIALPENLDPILRPIHTSWFEFFEKLKIEGRATRAFYQESIFWVAIDRINTFLQLYPGATFDPNLQGIDEPTVEASDALVSLIRGWLFHLGPTTVQELNLVLKLDPRDIEIALLTLESQGVILRGQFSLSSEEAMEWCERRLLARIHRLTISALRKEIEPVSPSQYMQWLLKWQHVAPGTQLHDEEGLLEIIKKLQGFEIPANAWENQIFKKRLDHYYPSLLDHLCLTGVIAWGRISSHPAIAATDSVSATDRSTPKRVIPRSVAPITFFVREESDWLPTENRFNDVETLLGLSPIAKSVYAFLKQRGASFMADIIRGVDKLQAEVETALWELVAGGVITADSFDNLRALIDPKRRRDQRRRKAQLRYSTGRWSLLYFEKSTHKEKQVEACCWMLLHRYGIVFRDLLAREKNIPKWHELLMTFRRLEAKGEIRGGRFVSQFKGEQFALPYAVDSLRAMKQQETDDQEITLSTLDPLNLVGIILPGEKLAAMGQNQVTLKNGQVL